MKKVLIVATYFNNPHFIEYQYKSFQKYLKEDYDFVVLDDSRPTTRSVLSNRNSGREIQEECTKYNAKKVSIPQRIHHGKKNDAGGRHQANLNWYFSSRICEQNPWGSKRTFDNKEWDHPERFNKQLYNKYDYVLIIDADVFITEPFSFEEEFNNDEYTVVGPRYGGHGFSYVNIGFMGINLKNMPYEKISEMSFSGTRNPHCTCPRKQHPIDSGGALYHFFTKYPNYKIKYMAFRPKLYNFQAGSNWNHKIEKYKNKLKILFETLQLD